uniref:EF-hand domain-containing protein n=3 Tax=Lotharella oceanica TaxID=641309 RepID=A0A7S2TVH4_9EUKA
MRTALTALRTFFRSRRLARPALALVGGVSLVGIAKNTCQAEMKPAAVEMKNVFPSEVMEKQNLHNLMKYSDKKGNISLEFFTMAMNELGVHNSEVVQSFFRTLDTDGNGSVSFEEFVAGIAAIGSDTAEPLSRLKFVFDSCDLDGNGVIQKEELRKMIHALLVTRENLWMYERRSEIDRDLEKEFQQRSLAIDLEMNTFDEWHKAVLIRQNDEEEEEYGANLGVTAADTDPLDKARSERMQQIYASFPHLKGKPLNVCLASLAVCTRLYKSLTACIYTYGYGYKIYICIYRYTTLCMHRNLFSST